MRSSHEQTYLDEVLNIGLGVIFLCPMTRPNEENRSYIDKYIKNAVIRGLSEERQRSLFYNLKWYTDRAKKPYLEMTADDVEDLVYQLEKTEYTAWTKYTRKAVLINFFKYLGKPEVTKAIKIRLPKSKLVKSDLYDYDLLKKLLDACTVNWRALYAATYDGNFRKGEVLSCHIENFKPHDNYAELSYTDSKNQVGTKILTISVPYILEWLETHPTKDDPQSPLWLTYHSKWRRWVPITTRTIGQHIRRAAAKAGIKKRTYPHLLRHSRTTQHILNKTPRRIVEKSGGWVEGSKALDRYDHLGDEDYKNEMLHQAGLTLQDTKPAPKLIVCPWCQTLNPPKQIKCREPKCRRNLDPWKQSEIDRKSQEQMDILMAKIDALEKRRIRDEK